jgi:hypothetical protein
MTMDAVSSPAEGDLSSPVNSAGQVSGLAGSVELGQGTSPSLTTSCQTLRPASLELHQLQKKDSPSFRKSDDVFLGWHGFPFVGGRASWQARWCLSPAAGIFERSQVYQGTGRFAYWPTLGDVSADLRILRPVSLYLRRLPAALRRQPRAGPSGSRTPCDKFGTPPGAVSPGEPHKTSRFPDVEVSRTRGILLRCALSVEPAPVCHREDAPCAPLGWRWAR